MGLLRRANFPVPLCAVLLLLRTILSFSSMLAPKFSCATSRKFVNVTAAFGATGYYHKINRFKIKIAEK